MYCFSDVQDREYAILEEGILPQDLDPKDEILDPFIWKTTLRITAKYSASLLSRQIDLK